MTGGVGYSIRPTRRDDGPFLTDMLVEAANWNHISARPRVEVLADPRAMKYVRGWQRPGDAGVVAETPEGDPVGACWFRLLPAEDPGYGFVAPGVPELTLGVRPIWRARGVGRSLLQAVVRLAASTGHSRLSLSVERDNHAVRLYRSEGFTTVESGVNSDTMVRLLR